MGALDDLGVAHDGAAGIEAATMVKATAARIT
jgi:hypothetical protein